MIKIILVSFRWYKVAKNKLNMGFFSLFSSCNLSRNNAITTMERRPQIKYMLTKITTRLFSGTIRTSEPFWDRPCPQSLAPHMALTSSPVEFVELDDDLDDCCRTAEDIKFPQIWADWNIMKNMPKNFVMTTSWSLLLALEYAMAVVVR